MKPGFIVRSTLAMLLLVAGAAMAKDAMSPRHARGEKSEKSEKAEKPENAMQTLAIGAPAPMRGVKMKAVDGRRSVRDVARRVGAGEAEVLALLERLRGWGLG